MELNITFEIDPNNELEGVEGTPIDKLHEALCLAIHEQDPKALEWLTNSILDIK